MRAISALVGGLYALGYLFGIGDLAFESGAGWLIRTAAVSLERIFSMRSPFLFEALAMVEAGWWVVLVSPVNLAIAALLGTLLTLNVHGVISLWRAPRSCSLPGLAGAWGALPALLAGSACCAPVRYGPGGVTGMATSRGRAAVRVSRVGSCQLPGKKKAHGTWAQGEAELSALTGCMTTGDAPAPHMDELLQLTIVLR